MMDNPMQDVKKTMFWLTIGTLVYFFCQWLLSILVARIAGYQVAGDYALVLTTSNLFYSFALFGMRPYQISDTRHQYSDKAYLVSRMITCGVAFATGIGFCLLNDYSVMQNTCLLIFLVYRMTEAGMDVFHGMLQSASRMEIAGKSLIIRGLASVVLFGAGLMLFKALLPALLAMTLFSVLWLGLFEYSQAEKVSRNYLTSGQRVGMKDLGRLFAACLPLLAGNLVYSLILFVPRYYVESIYGGDMLGVYASIAAPALIVPVMAQYIYTPYMPAISEYYIERKKKDLSRLILKLTLTVVTMGIAMLLAGGFLGEWGLVVLFGESIRAHAYLLMPILLSVVCTALVYYLNAIVISVRKNNIIYISSAAAAVAILAVSHLFVAGSVNGASFALIAAQLAQVVILAAGYMLLKKA